MKRKLASLILLSVLAGAAGAVTETNKELTLLGTQGSNVYFRIDGGFSGGCLFDVVYLPSSSTFGKFAYATLLSAKVTDTELSRIDYSVDPSSSVCVLTLIELNE